MKKSLLLVSAALLATSASFAAPVSVEYAPKFIPGPKVMASSMARMQAPLREGEETPSLIFSYAGDLGSTYSLNNVINGQYIYQAFKFAKSDQVPYVGNTITSVNVMTGSSSTGKSLIGKVDVFIAKSVEEIIDVLDKGHKLPTDQNVVFPVELANPYEITADEDLYIGYRFKFLRDCYYIPADQIVTDQETMLLSVVSGADTQPEFINYADQIGSLCLSITITGDNLPTDSAQPTSLDLLGYYAPGENFSYDLKIKNFGSNNVESVKVLTSIDNGVSVETPFQFNPALVPGQSATITVGDVPNPSEGVLTLSTSVSEVNGKTIDNPVALTGTFASYSGGFPRKAVIEEGTGAWCGYCVRGIVMMEYLEEHYPEWIRIAVHSGDRMETASYGAMISKYYEGFPQAISNRIIETPVAGDDDSAYKPIYRAITSEPTYVKVNISAEEAEEGSSVNVTATTEFSIDGDNNPLQLAFVLVEDFVGPYDQTNYYSGGGLGPMGGYENLGSSVSTVYMDVARYLDGYPGIKGSLPEEVKAGEQYVFERNISLESIKGDKYRIVAFVVDPQSGEIINADQIYMYETGVKAMNADDLTISVINGNISVYGAKNVSVYTLDGRRVSATNLPAGLYIVNADGIGHKVLVK